MALDAPRARMLQVTLLVTMYEYLNHCTCMFSIFSAKRATVVRPGFGDQAKRAHTVWISFEMYHAVQP